MAKPEIPGDLILPDPQDEQELTLYRSLQDNSRQVNTALEAVGDTQDKVKSSSDDTTAGYLDAKVDDSTIEIGSEKLQLKDDGVTGAKLSAAVAGSGLTQDGSGNLDVNVDDSTIEINTDTVRVKADGVNDTHIRLQNNAYLTARNAANDGDVDVIKVNSSDVPVIPDGTETATNAAPTSDNDVANKKYVDDQITANPGGMTLLSSNTGSGVTNTGNLSVSTGNRYYVTLEIDNATNIASNLNFRFNSNGTASAYTWGAESIAVGAGTNGAGTGTDDRFPIADSGIGAVSSLNTSGNSGCIRGYMYIDTNPFSGSTYAGNVIAHYFVNDSSAGQDYVTGVCHWSQAAVTDFEFYASQNFDYKIDIYELS
jgi:hypothetical protein